jgi:release factor glutamine methyltransferase
VLATDRSPDALAVARANLAGLGRAAGRVSLHEGSWFDSLPMSVRGAIDVLVSNPPYIGDDEELPAVVAEWEPSEALRAGPVGDEDLQTILHGADEWVAPGGAVVLEMAPDQTAVIADRFRAAGWQSSIHGDLAGRDRAVVARKRG